ncbi:MAG: hypothetical protein ACRDSH_17785, partial [Pseudonocardiaceae bacterium]
MPAIVRRRRLAVGGASGPNASAPGGQPITNNSGTLIARRLALISHQSPIRSGCRPACRRYSRLPCVICRQACGELLGHRILAG